MTNSRLTDPEILDIATPSFWKAIGSPEDPAARDAGRVGTETIRRTRFLEPMTAAILSNHRRIPPFGMQRRSTWLRSATSGSSIRMAGSRS